MDRLNMDDIEECMGRYNNIEARRGRGRDEGEMDVNLEHGTGMDIEQEYSQEEDDMMMDMIRIAIIDNNRKNKREEEGNKSPTRKRRNKTNKCKRKWESHSGISKKRKELVEESINLERKNPTGKEKSVDKIEEGKEGECMEKDNEGMDLLLRDMNKVVGDNKEEMKDNNNRHEFSAWFKSRNSLIVLKLK